MTFIKQLAAAWQKNNSLLCVGLDPDPAKFPAHLKGRDDAIFEFCAAIVDATADLVCSFKPQIAYFAARRAEDQLEALIARDSVEPYLAYPDKGVILLCRTSNPGGSDLQFLETNGEKLYERVARLAAHEWNTSGQISLVVGATFPAEIARVRAIVGDVPLLVPGIGAQGGDIEATVKAGRTANATGLMINSSRAILYAGKDEGFAAAARKVALETRDAINQYR